MEKSAPTLKVEGILSEEFIQQLEQRILTTVESALNKHIDKIRTEKVNLTRQQAAARLKISLPTLQKHINSGKLKASKVGRRMLITESSIEELLNNTL